MAIRVNVSQDDVARTRIVEDAGWRKVVVKDINVERNKKGDADNFVTDFEVIDDPDENGIRARVWFSEKAIGMMVPFLKALGVDVPNTGLADFDLEPAIGRKLQVMIQAEDNDGRMNNNVKGYRPYDA